MSGSHSAHARRKHTRSWPLRVLAGLGGLVVLAGLGALALVLFGRPQVHFSSSSTALADMSVGGVGAHLRSLAVTVDGKAIAVSRAGGSLTPTHALPAGAPVHLDATASAPSWLSWLVGSTTTTSLTMVTPRVRPDTTVTLATVRSSASSASRHVAVHFSGPVSVLAYRTDAPGATAQVTHIQPPATTVELPVSSGATGGMLEVAAAARPWETLPSVDHVVTWFAPINSHVPAVVADPAPGASLTTSTSAITLVFSQDVHSVLGSSRPSISPKVHGTWSEPTSHELVFTPSGFGYGPDTTVTVAFDHPVTVVGTTTASTTSASTTSASTASASTTSSSTSSATSSYSFSVQPGSVLRLEQLLAELHYLPLRFTPAPGTPTPSTMAGEEATMYAPLPGSFSWRYGNVPPTLAAQWAPGQPTVMVKGALMAFEGVEGTYDGYTLDSETVNQIADGSTWDQLLHAALAHQLNPNPYSYVYVSKVLPETLTIWQDGQVVLTSLTNTGIPQDPTADGTFPIYIRFVENYMNGTNPNGTTYHDLVHWINYFNGGDAVHGFVRASYGFPQSLGCAELPVATAAVAFTHLALGDLVTVAG